MDDLAIVSKDAQPTTKRAHMHTRELSSHDLRFVVKRFKKAECILQAG